MYVTVLGVSVSVCANTSSVRVRIYVTEVDVGRCPYAHITIERSLRHLCLGIYCVAQGMVDDITTSVPYSLKVHCTASIPELHRDLMWQDGYWAGSFAAAPFGFQ